MACELTGLARLPLLVLERAHELGLDRDELMRAAGLDAAELADPDARIRFSKQIKLWSAICARYDRPGIGLRLGSSLEPAQLGVVGYVMCNSSTLGEAYRRFARFSRVITEAMRVELSNDGDRTHLTLEVHPTLRLLREPLAANLLVLLNIGRKITGTKFAPDEVHLPFVRPANATDYRRVFGGTTRYGRPTAALFFKPRQMRLPVLAADLTLGGYLTELAQIRLNSLEDERGSLVGDLRRAMWPQLAGGKPDLIRTAAGLGISPRTLQRRLKKDGHTFASVLEQLRRELTADLLADGRTSVSEMALLLGYSEPSTFHRAFRRWTGVSPRKYRTRSRGESPTYP